MSYLTKDEAELKRFGYQQELMRSLGGFSNFAISFSVISILTGGITLYGYGLKTAGPLGIVFGWILVSLASLPIVFSMAELASAFPTAGALYHWSSFLGNKHYGWFTAWLNYLGQFAITAGIDYGLTEFLVSLLSLPSDGPTKFTVYGLILLSHGCVNHYGIRWVAIFNDVSAWYHVAGVLFLVGVIAFCAPLQNVTFLLKPVTTLSYPYYYVFCLGLLQAQWTLTGYDASAHVSEETVHVSAKVPLGMITSVISSSVLGLLMLIMITLAIGDLGSALKAERPFLFIMQSALGTRMGGAMVWTCVVAMWFCGLASLTSNSRMLYAFARDGGVPFHKVVASVSPKHKTPAPAIWISVVLAFLLALYGQAYAIVVGISTVLILGSYFLPIFLAARAQLRGRWKRTHKGVFHLGRWSVFNNIMACVWIAFISTMLLLPPNQLVLYATLVCVAILAILYLFVAQRFAGVAVSQNV